MHARRATTRARQPKPAPPCGVSGRVGNRGRVYRTFASAGTHPASFRRRCASRPPCGTRSRDRRAPARAGAPPPGSSPLHAHGLPGHGDQEVGQYRQVARVRLLHAVQVGTAVLAVDADGQPACAYQVPVQEHAGPCARLPSAKGWIWMKRWCSQAPASSGLLRNPVLAVEFQQEVQLGVHLLRRRVEVNGAVGPRGLLGKSFHTPRRSVRCTRRPRHVDRVVRLLMGGDLGMQLAHGVLGDGPVLANEGVDHFGRRHVVIQDRHQVLRFHVHALSAHMLRAEALPQQGLRDTVIRIVQALDDAGLDGHAAFQAHQALPDPVPGRGIHAQGAEASVPIILVVEPAFRVRGGQGLDALPVRVAGSRSHFRSPRRGIGFLDCGSMRPPPQSPIVRFRRAL